MRQSLTALFPLILNNKQERKIVKQKSNQHNSDRYDRKKYCQKFWFYRFRSIIIEGRESAVTAIIKERMVPSPAPFANRLRQPEWYRRYRHTSVHQPALQEEPNTIITAEYRLKQKTAG